jgi:hypothetical protein
MYACVCTSQIHTSIEAPVIPIIALSVASDASMASMTLCPERVREFESSRVREKESQITAEIEKKEEETIHHSSATPATLSRQTNLHAGDQKYHHTRTTCTDWRTLHRESDSIGVYTQRRTLLLQSVRVRMRRQPLLCSAHVNPVRARNANQK